MMKQRSATRALRKQRFRLSSLRIVSFACFLMFTAGMLIANTPSIAAGDILYESNFADVPDGELPPGFIVNDGTWSVMNGRLIGSAASSQNGQIVFGDSSWTNYEIEATVTFLNFNTATRWASIIYRAPERGGVPFYSFAIRGDSRAANGIELAQRNEDVKWVVHMTESWAEGTQVGKEYKLKVIVYDTGVMYFLDDKPVLQTEHLIQVPAGKPGFMVNGSRMAVHHVVVRTVDENTMNQLSWLKPGVVPEYGTAAGPRPPLVVAHRGASGTAPENTVAAFKKAIEYGVDMVELDVHKTRDGHLVVIHDATVDRTTAGAFKGRVDSLTLEQIKTLDAGSFKGAEWRGEPVPTLEEALLFADGNTLFFVEGKVNGIEKDIASVVQATGMDNNFVYQSFNRASVHAFRELMPHVPAALLFRDPDIPDDRDRAALMVSEAQKANASIVAVNYNAVTPAFVRYVQARGLHVWVWTVNSEADMRRMIDAGVDGILSNYPEVLIKLLGK